MFGMCFGCMSMRRCNRFKRSKPLRTKEKIQTTWNVRTGRKVSNRGGEAKWFKGLPEGRIPSMAKVVEGVSGPVEREYFETHGVFFS